MNEYLGTHQRDRMKGLVYMLQQHETKEEGSHGIDTSTPEQGNKNETINKSYKEGNGAWRENMSCLGHLKRRVVREGGGGGGGT